MYSSFIRLSIIFGKKIKHNVTFFKNLVNINLLYVVFNPKHSIVIFILSLFFYTYMYTRIRCTNFLVLFYLLNYFSPKKCIRKRKKQLKIINA